MTTDLPEVWLRGPVEGVPPLLQPIAHTLLQAVEEVKKIMQDFPEELLWKRPASVASPAFHLQHISGVIDRLSSYALGKTLSGEQMAYLQSEGKETFITSQQLIQQFEQKVNAAIGQLKKTDETKITEHRSVGRKALPSTVMGLLFHAAEHTMRHVGQLLVTVRLIKNDGQ
jgi:uncharacterized damage-inducible protein DinB